MKLEVRNLTFGYDETRVILNDVSFTLEGSGIMRARSRRLRRQRTGLVKIIGWNLLYQEIALFHQ